MALVTASLTAVLMSAISGKVAQLHREGRHSHPGKAFVLRQAKKFSSMRLFIRFALLWGRPAR